MSVWLATARIGLALPIFGLGQFQIHLLQAQIALPTLFVVGLFRQGGAPCRLRSEPLCSHHSRHSDYPARQPHCNIFYDATQHQTVMIRNFSSRHDQIGRHDLNRLVVLVERGGADFRQALLRARTRRPHLQDFAFDAEPVARPHRARPAHLFDAGADDAAGERQPAFDQKLHGHRRGVPSARGKAFEEGLRRSRLVEMKRLRIELPGEGLDRLGSRRTPDRRLSDKFVPAANPQDAEPKASFESSLEISETAPGITTAAPPAAAPSSSAS